MVKPFWSLPLFLCLSFLAHGNELDFVRVGSYIEDQQDHSHSFISGEGLVFQTQNGEPMLLSASHLVFGKGVSFYDSKEKYLLDGAFRDDHIVNDLSVFKLNDSLYSKKSLKENPPYKINFTYIPQWKKICTTNTNVINKILNIKDPYLQLGNSYYIVGHGNLPSVDDNKYLHKDFPLSGDVDLSVKTPLFSLNQSLELIHNGVLGAKVRLVNFNKDFSKVLVAQPTIFGYSGSLLIKVESEKLACIEGMITSFSNYFPESYAAGWKSISDLIEQKERKNMLWSWAYENGQTYRIHQHGIKETDFRNNFCGGKSSGDGGGKSSNDGGGKSSGDGGNLSSRNSTKNVALNVPNSDRLVPGVNIQGNHYIYHTPNANDSLEFTLNEASDWDQGLSPRAVSLEDSDLPKRLHSQAYRRLTNSSSFSEQEMRYLTENIDRLKSEYSKIEKQKDEGVSEPLPIHEYLSDLTHPLCVIKMTKNISDGYQIRLIHAMEEKVMRLQIIERYWYSRSLEENSIYIKLNSSGRITHFWNPDTDDMIISEDTTSAYSKSKENFDFDVKNIEISMFKKMRLDLSGLFFQQAQYKNLFDRFQSSAYITVSFSGRLPARKTRALPITCVLNNSEFDDEFQKFEQRIR